MTDATVESLEELKAELEKRGLDKCAQLAGALLNESRALVEMVRQDRKS